MRKFRFIFIILIIFISYPVLSQDDELDLLFIGNSLTYTNDLPELVEKTAKAQGLEVRSKMIAKPNYALLDHWNEGKVQKMIKNRNFDLVIIQQGPSSQDFGKDILIEYGKKLKDLCSENNAKLAYFMVWPSREYYHTFKGVIKNHKEAAEINQAMLFPVGEVWKKHFDNTGNFDYYGPDQFHPSEKGSQIAAEIIVEGLQKMKTDQ
ncbi:SGNH/GDSL hydrolase family protein [Christiangramia sp. SM2212]|uniref:SGNH/GDSL hydrolase family protein n=1 Tax=Christiangramia sediminicola TaxID=3073267 RepID=A0ABU1ERJ7_9FLAO|nr:SGNH/GDSL hydrolase family protein [Christiangramia sp. SM2212]MDR5591018.1 SGNH/GDSL hydrolase family protein [Christiangramia sp. SM2212]